MPGIPLEPEGLFEGDRSADPGGGPETTSYGVTPSGETDIDDYTTADKSGCREQETPDDYPSQADLDRHREDMDDGIVIRFPRDRRKSYSRADLDNSPRRPQTPRVPLREPRHASVGSDIPPF